MRPMTATLLSTLLVAALSGCEKYDLDRQMEALCKADGGVKVYEVVTLPVDRFDSTGRLITGPAQDMGGGLYVKKVTEGLRIEWRTDAIKAGEPFGKALISEGRLLRFSTRVVRTVDNKVLGEEISYGRSGGEISIGHPSQNFCPRPRPAPDVVQAVILKGQ
ncbi:MAG: hypothetical protein JSR75_21330 [Proteobacteria bacterium]|nr:hypothetical protein [Pseudomonadota bacterium]